MDPVALQVVAAQAQTQMAVAANIAKMNVGADKAVAALVEQASASLDEIVSAPPPGAGQLLDISV